MGRRTSGSLWLLVNFDWLSMACKFLLRLRGLWLWVFSIYFLVETLAISNAMSRLTSHPVFLSWFFHGFLRASLSNSPVVVYRGTWLIPAAPGVVLARFTREGSAELCGSRELGVGRRATSLRLGIDGVCHSDVDSFRLDSSAAELHLWRGKNCLEQRSFLLLFYLNLCTVIEDDKKKELRNSDAKLRAFRGVGAKQRGGAMARLRRRVFRLRTLLQLLI